MESTAVAGQDDKPRVDASSPEVLYHTEPPPGHGVTIEFPFSTSASFDFAVESARALPGFRQFGEAKKALYRVTLDPSALDDRARLL